jgi:hypothetical protein
MNFGGEIEDSRSSVQLGTMGKIRQSGESLPKNSGKEIAKCKKCASVSKTKFVWN